MRRSLGLYWPDSNNVVVTSNLLKDKTANSLELVAHEFAHSLIGHKEKPWITHDGHGPSFYYRLMRYVV
jgi:hypothetical protein